MRPFRKIVPMPYPEDDDAWQDSEFDEDEEASHDDLNDDTNPCPHCGREVYEDAPQCPHCGHYIIKELHSRRKPWWIVVGVVVCLYVVVHWMFL